MIMNFNYRGKTIELNEVEHDEIYQFYRLHCTIEELKIYLSETLTRTFHDTESSVIAAKRVLELKDGYDVSEEEAICAVCDDAEVQPLKNHQNDK